MLKQTLITKLNELFLIDGVIAYNLNIHALDIKSDKGRRWHLNTGAEQWSDIKGRLFTMGCRKTTQHCKS